MSEALNGVELEIIENGEEDWVLFAHIMGIVEEAHGVLLSDELAVAQASDACLTLCAKGLVRLGRYMENGTLGFVAWLETGAALEVRLKHELATPPAGCDTELNLQRVMLDILPAGIAAWKQQEKQGP